MKLLLLFSLKAVCALAFQNCPLLGADLPAPSPASISTANLTLALNSALSSGVLGATNSSFSIEVFSASQPGAFFSFYHSAPTLNASVGVKQVDGNSVFRIGSISKLFTVYLLLIENGFVNWHDPVTKWVPELWRIGKWPSNAVLRVDWGSITLGNLASQMAGIGRDYVLSEFLASIPESALTVFGFPKINDTAVLPCVLAGKCNRRDFFTGFIPRHPLAPSSSTPIYSNVAFQILGYAIEEITGESYTNLLQHDIIDRLHLNRTTYSTPSPSLGVIPDSGVNGSSWNLDIGDETPAGGLYSSSADLSALGQSILTSKLLSPSITRRWMKPITHTANIFASVGAPWEITRYQYLVPARIIDIYGKDGGFGAYTSKLALIPDWDIGFVVLKAGGADGLKGDLLTILNLIASSLFPAVDAAARSEANANYAGHYVSADGKSSLNITTDSLHPGLGLASWTSNGVDMFQVVVAQGIASSPTIRLYPTGLKSTLNGSTTIGWRAVIESSDSVGIGPFGDICESWGGVDTLMYDEVGVDDFTFVLRGDGKAVSVQPRVMKISLARA